MFNTCLGAYVPLTEEGNVLVDGLLASCYPSTDQNVAHIIMTPLIWFPEIMECMFATDSGIQVSVGIAEQLGKWILPTDQFVTY